MVYYPVVNECRMGIDNCHEKARCVDTYKSFRCVCKNGYEGNGVQCSGKKKISTNYCTPNKTTYKLNVWVHFPVFVFYVGNINLIQA